MVLKNKILNKDDIAVAMSLFVDRDLCNDEFVLKIIDTFDSISTKDLTNIVTIFDLTSKLTKEQLLFLVNKNYSTDMMEMISKIFSDGCSIEEINKLISNPIYLNQQSKYSI